jgi:hypothetical protein
VLSHDGVAQSRQIVCNRICHFVKCFN